MSNTNVTRMPVFLTNRQEIAQAMNFGKYPVLSMEVGTPPPGWEPFTIYQGCKVKIRFSSRKDLYNVCTLSMYHDEQPERLRNVPWMWEKLCLSSHCTCLSSSFGFSDLQEMLENANAPWVEPGQEVIVVFNDSVNKQSWVRKMVVADYVSDHCSTVTTLLNPVAA